MSAQEIVKSTNMGHDQKYYDMIITQRSDAVRHGRTDTKRNK